MTRDVPDAELDAAIESWRSQGYAVIPAVADEATLAGLRKRLDDLVAGRAPDPGLFFQKDSGTGDYRDVGFGQGYEGPDVPYRKIEKLERDPRFFAWLSAPVFRRIAERALGSSVTLYRATVFQKAARVGSDLPWHQDGGRFWGLDRDPCLQAWTALDDAPTEAGCLEVLPGSHHRGLASPMGGLVPAILAGDVEGIRLPARAGDVVLIHNLLWHRSGANRTERPRRAFSASYLHGDTRCTRKKRAPRQFTPVF